MKVRLLTHRFLFRLGAGVIAALALTASNAIADTNTANITLSASSGTAIDGSTFAEIDVATDVDTTLQIDLLPGFTSLDLTPATIDVDTGKNAISINGAATVLGATADVLVTATWADAATDTAPVITFGVKFTTLSIDTINDSWTPLGGELPLFNDAWAIVASTPHTLDLATLPDGAGTFYGSGANGMPLNSGLNFRGSLNVTDWEALGYALGALSIDASAIDLEGVIGSPGLLFDNANADKSSLALSATVNGNNLPPWMTSSTTTVGFVFDGATPSVSLSNVMDTDFGGAANTFSSTIAFDPNDYGAGTVAAEFALVGVLDAPFDADFLMLSDLTLSVSADLGTSPIPLTASLAANVELPDASLVAVTIAVAVDGPEVTGSFALAGAITLTQILGTFGRLLPFDATALATDDVSLDSISFSFAIGGAVDRFEVSASATVDALVVDVLVAGTNSGADTEVVVGLNVTEVDGTCQCIRLGTLLDLPAGSAVADLELPEVHLLVPLQATTLNAADLGPATTAFFERIYGTLPATIELTAGINLAAQLPLDPLGDTVQAALGYADGAEVVIEGSLGISLSAFAGGGSVDVTSVSLQATLPAVTGDLTPWVQLSSGWTLGIDYADSAFTFRVDADVDVSLPDEPTLSGTIAAVVTKSGADFSVHVEASIGAWSQPFGLSWLNLSEVVLTIDYENEAGATTVAAALSSAFEVGGKAFTLDVGISASGDTYDLTFSAALADTLTVGEMLQFLGVGVGDVPSDILSSSLGPISLTATVQRTSIATTFSVALGGAVTITIGGSAIQFDFLVALDQSGDYRLGLRAANNLTLSSIVPGLPDGLDFAMPAFSIVLANADSKRSSDTLATEEFNFFAPVYGCGSGDGPDDCSFEVDLREGVSIVANAPLPTSLDTLSELGIDTAAGIQIQGTIPLFGSGEIALSVTLPPWTGPEKSDWFKSGTLSIDVSPTSLSIGGELVIRLPKSDSSNVTCESDESQCDILTFELSATLELGGTGLSFSLEGRLSTDAPWEQAFGIEWLTINELVLQIGVTTSPLLFTLGFRGDVVIGTKDISISMAAGLTPFGIPIFLGFRAASAAGLELADVIALQNQFAPSSPIQLGSGLPNIAIRNIELMFAITENPALCLTPGLVIAGDLFINPSSPAGADASGGCTPTPPSPETSTECLNDSECLASVRLSVSDQGIIAIGQLSAFDLGPVAFEDALIDLTLTTSDQHLTLSGGIAIDNFGSGHLALTIGSTEFSFEGEVQLFDTFFASLSGTATLDSPPGVHVEGLIRQELVASLNEALRPFFEDFGAVVTVINGIIDELQDPTKSLDDVASKILMAPADLRALGIAVPQWLIDLTNGINDGLDAYADLTGTQGPFSSLLDPILTGIDVTITTGVVGTIVPRTCVGSWVGSDCWTIKPIAPSSYKVKVWPFGKVTVKVPGVPGVPGVIIPATCLVVTIGGTCYAVPPIVLPLPGLCDIAAVSDALQPCNSTGLKNAIVGLLEDGFEAITGVTIDDVQATLQEIADSVSSANLVLIDAPCIGFDLDLGGQSSNAFFLDFHLVLFNQDIYFTNIGWDFGKTVAENAAAIQTRLVNVLLGIEDGSGTGNKCLGVNGGGSSTPVGNVVPPSNVVVTPGATTVAEGTALSVTGTFDQGSAPTANTSVTINWGDGTSSTVTPTAGAFSGTHVYVDDNPTGTPSDVHNLTAVVTNASTGTASGTSSVTVLNVAPTIDTFVRSATSIVEGGTVTISGTYSDAGTDTHTLAVTWGDGSSQTVAVTNGTFSLTKAYPDDIPTNTPADTYAISATLRDDDGAAVSTSTSVTVSNAQPTVALSVAEQTIDEGGTVVLSGTITDVGLLDLHEITVDWGDGTPPEVFALPVGARAFVQTHIYTDDNPTGTPSDDYTITVNVTDDDQGASTSTQVVTVDNVAPSDVVLGFGSIVLSEGDETGVFISFNDPGGEDVHTVTVDWGDNSASSTVTLPVGTRQELLSHVYEDDNPTGTPQDTYPISVTIVDDDGASVTQAIAQVYDADTDTYVTGVPIATISNVDPNFDPLVLTPSIDENGTASLSGSFEDPGLLDTYELVIDWGDGTPTDTLFLDATDRGLVADPDTGLDVTSTFVDFATTHQYLDDNPTGTASDDYTVTVTVTDDDTGTDTASAVITVNDVAPVVDATPDTQTPQYSDPLAEDIVLTAYDVAGYAGPTETLTAATQWSYGAGPFQSGLPAALGMVSNGCNPGGELGSTAPRQTCTWTVSGISDVAPGLYTIRFTVTDDDGQSSTTDVTIDLQPEDATAYYTGPSFAATASANNGSADIELRATILDITTEDQMTTGWDSTPGDITHAIVDFIDRETGAVLCTATVEPLFAGSVALGTAACNWHVELAGNADAEIFVIGTIVRGWYVRDETDDDAVVTVAKPLNQFITGGGYLDYTTEWNGSAGVYATDDGTKANFGFNVKFNKKGTNLKGRATVIIRSDGNVYKIKTNALQSLGVVGASAEFEAKANLTDVTDGDNPISLGGGLTFQMNMTDFGTPNDSDTIGWTLYDKDGILLFSSNWNGVDTDEHVAKGNLVVHD